MTRKVVEEIYAKAEARIEYLEKENLAFAEIIRKQDEEISELLRKLAYKENIEEEHRKIIKNTEKMAIRTIETLKKEIAELKGETI